MLFGIIGLFAASVVLFCLAASLLLSGCGQQERKAEQLAARKLLVRTQVMTESGLNQNDLVALHREVAELTRSARHLGNVTNALSAVVEDLESAVYFSGARYKAINPETALRIRRLGLSGDWKVWRIVETEEWLRENERTIQVFVFSDKNNGAERRWFNQRYVLGHVLDDVHRAAAAALRELR